MKRKYAHQLLVAVDQLINAALAGWADETLSSRAYRSQHKRRWLIAVKVINSIFFWQENHCRQSYEYEALQGHLPVGFRDE